MFSLIVHWPSLLRTCRSDLLYPTARHSTHVWEQGLRTAQQCFTTLAPLSSSLQAPSPFPYPLQSHPTIITRHSPALPCSHMDLLYLICIFPIVCILFCGLVSMIDPVISGRHGHCHNLRYDPITCSPVSPSPSRPTIPSVAESDFSLHLQSDSHCNLPTALNSHLTCADFDPDFVATLLSCTNISNYIVDIILKTG
jgi:hypothetical protein